MAGMTLNSKCKQKLDTKMRQALKEVPRVQGLKAIGFAAKQKIANDEASLKAGLEAHLEGIKAVDFAAKQKVANGSKP